MAVARALALDLAIALARAVAVAQQGVQVFDIQTLRTRP